MVPGTQPCPAWVFAPEPLLFCVTFMFTLLFGSLCGLKVLGERDVTLQAWSLGVQSPGTHQSEPAALGRWWGWGVCVCVPSQRAAQLQNGCWSLRLSPGAPTRPGFSTTAAAVLALRRLQCELRRCRCEAQVCSAELELHT